MNRVLTCDRKSSQDVLNGSNNLPAFYDFIIYIVFRVFLVKLDHLVLLDQEVNVVSLVKSDLLDHKVLLDPVEMPVLPVLTDKR